MDQEGWTKQGGLDAMRSDPVQATFHDRANRNRAFWRKNVRIWAVRGNDTKDNGCFGLQPNKWWCHTLRWGRLGEKQGSGGTVLDTGFGTSDSCVGLQTGM